MPLPTTGVPIPRRLQEFYESCASRPAELNTTIIWDRLVEAETLLEQVLPSNDDPYINIVVHDEATFNPELQEARSGGTIGDWMRRAKAANAQIASYKTLLSNQATAIIQLTAALEKIREQFYKRTPPNFQLWHDIIDEALGDTK